LRQKQSFIHFLVEERGKIQVVVLAQNKIRAGVYMYFRCRRNILLIFLFFLNICLFQVARVVSFSMCCQDGCLLLCIIISMISCSQNINKNLLPRCLSSEKVSSK
jgi:hypothetical protein